MWRWCFAPPPPRFEAPDDDDDGDGVDHTDGYDLIKEETFPDLVLQVPDDAVAVFVALVNQLFNTYGPQAVGPLFGAAQLNLYHDVAGHQPFLCPSVGCPGPTAQAPGGLPS